MDGKCTVTKRRVVQLARTSARSPPRCATALQAAQLQMDPEVLQRQAGGEPCHSDWRGKQGETQWTLAPSSGKGFMSL